MDMLNLLHSEKIKHIILRYSATKEEKKQAAYNLCTVSSYNSYLENFHSDILASLLSPKGLHKQHCTFLHLFIEYLNAHYNTALFIANFTNSTVSREKGRLDIWVRDETSRQSIIIENKINNASDMDEQLDRYFNYSEKSHNYTVKAIVYLSLDGTKQAPPTIENLGHLVKNIGAFTNQDNDLIAGWLQPCLQASATMDSKSFIHQYSKLIRHLANKNMDTNTMEAMYSFLSTHNGMETVNTLVEMADRMPSYRADRFSVAIKDYAPFRKQFRYKPQYCIYENYRYQNCFFKLDVWFEQNGNAAVVFWNTSIEGPLGRKIIEEKLNAINMLSEFEDIIVYNGNGYPKYFLVGNMYRTMAEVDEAVIKFVKNFMAALQTP